MIASLKEATNRIHQLLQCSRCHELLQDPVALPCMHRFCRRCLKPSAECATCGHPYFRSQLRAAPKMGSLSLLCAQLEEQLRAVAASESEGAAQDDSKSSDKAMVEAEETTTCEHAVAQGASLQAMSGPCHDGESTLRAHEEPGGEKEEAASSTERCSAAAAPKTTTSKAGSSTAAATLTVAPNVPTAATEAADGVAPTEEPAALKERESRELQELKREMELLERRVRAHRELILAHAFGPLAGSFDLPIAPPSTIQADLTEHSSLNGFVFGDSDVLEFQHGGCDAHGMQGKGTAPTMLPDISSGVSRGSKGCDDRTARPSTSDEVLDPAESSKHPCPDVRSGLAGQPSAASARCLASDAAGYSAVDPSITDASSVHAPSSVRSCAGGPMDLTDSSDAAASIAAAAPIAATSARDSSSSTANASSARTAQAAAARTAHAAAASGAGARTGVARTLQQSALARLSEGPVGAQQVARAGLVAGGASLLLGGASTVREDAAPCRFGAWNESESSFALIRAQADRKDGTKERLRAALPDAVASTAEGSCAAEGASCAAEGASCAAPQRGSAAAEASTESASACVGGYRTRASARTPPLQSDKEARASGRESASAGMERRACDSGPATVSPASHQNTLSLAVDAQGLAFSAQHTLCSAGTCPHGKTTHRSFGEGQSEPSVKPSAVPSPRGDGSAGKSLADAYGVRTRQRGKPPPPLQGEELVAHKPRKQACMPLQKKSEHRQEPHAQQGAVAAQAHAQPRSRDEASGAKTKKRKQQARSTEPLRQNALNESGRVDADAVAPRVEGVPTQKRKTNSKTAAAILGDGGQRESSTTAPLILFTGLESDESSLYAAIAKTLGGRTTKEWRASVTHVVSGSGDEAARTATERVRARAIEEDADDACKCGANARGEASASARLCGRTIKFCKSVLHGQWIVSLEWLKHSADQKRWLNEEAYEMEGDFTTMDPVTRRGAGGPRAGRLRKEHAEPKLFVGLSFFLHGDFVKPSRGEMSALLQAGGGIIMESLPDRGNERDAKRTIVISQESPPSAALVARCAESSLPPPIDAARVMNAISYHKVDLLFAGTT